VSGEKSLERRQFAGRFGFYGLLAFCVENDGDDLRILTLRDEMFFE
jgi:hypothetical protein